MTKEKPGANNAARNLFASNKFNHHANANENANEVGET